MRPRDTGDIGVSAGSLVNIRSGKRYPLRHGVPDFVNTVSGQNQKYQGRYDRIAVIYDLSDPLYVWFTRKQQFRRAFLDEVEVPSGARVLEVSVGTGTNFRYFSSDTKLFGLDLSWGVLRQRRKNLRKWNRTAELFHAEAEHLPFRGVSSMWCAMWAASTSLR